MYCLKDIDNLIFGAAVEIIDIQNDSVDRHIVAQATLLCREEFAQSFEVAMDGGDHAQTLRVIGTAVAISDEIT